MPVTTNTRKLAALLGASGAGIHTDGTLQSTAIKAGAVTAAKVAADVATQSELDAIPVFDDSKLQNDVSVLALRQAVNEDNIKYNTNSSYVDVFQDATGVTALTNCARDAAEHISTLGAAEWEDDDPGPSADYTVTSAGSYVTAPTASKLYGVFPTGIYSNDNIWTFSSGEVIEASVYITSDLGAGNSKIFTGHRWWTGAANGNGNWDYQGSNDNSSWTDLATNKAAYTGWNWPAAQAEHTWTNSTAYRYVRVKGRSGTVYDWRQHYWMWQVASFNATGSFECNAITASSSVSSMGAIITYQDNAGTNALNTDIILKLSANGGTNYSTATLVAMPDFSSGTKMAKVNDLSVTAGTSLKYQLSFVNQAAGSKVARITGVGLQF